MSRHADRTVRRAPILLLVAAALIAGGLADRVGAPASGRATDAARSVPVVAPAAALSTSWFCAGAADSAMASPTDSPSGRVVIYNRGSTPEVATVDVVSSTGASATVRVGVGPTGTASVPETVPGGAAWTGAEVDVDGSAAVEEVLDGPLGRTIGQCATSGSADWYLPSGQTRVNASETILLFDPYPSDSIVDLSFTTNEGQEEPQDFEDITVPAGQLVAVDLGGHLRRRSSIATTVAARFGRVVAWSEEIVTPPSAGEVIAGTPTANTPLADPAAPVAGVDLALGAPSAGTRWEWPDGLAGNGINEQYVVYNPGKQTAEVSLAIGLQQGTAEPFDLTVGPAQVVAVVAEDETRIPAGSPHTATLTSSNGVPVVAVRTVDAADPGAAGGGLLGTSTMPGERLAADDWVVPWTGTDGSHRGQLVLYDAGPASATVTVTGAGPATAAGAGPATGTVSGAGAAGTVSGAGAAGTVTVTVPGGGRVAVGVDPGRAGPLTISSSRAVYAEYDLYADGTTGYSLGSAIPLSP